MSGRTSLTMHVANVCRRSCQRKSAIPARLSAFRHAFVFTCAIGFPSYVKTCVVRVLGPIPELTRIWRVLTTPELRHTPRVSALFDFLVDEVDTLRPIITG